MALKTCKKHVFSIEASFFSYKNYCIFNEKSMFSQISVSRWSSTSSWVCTKNVRTVPKQKNWTVFLAICIVLVFKTVFEIVIFRKIFDGDLTKITKMSRKIDQHGAICRKTLIFTFGTPSITTTGQFGARAEKSWILTLKSVRTARNHKNWTAFSTICFVLVFKTVFGIIISGKSSMGRDL